LAYERRDRSCGAIISKRLQRLKPKPDSSLIVCGSRITTFAVVRVAAAAIDKILNKSSRNARGFPTNAYACINQIFSSRLPRRAADE
jgi:hypothetical protein